MAGLGIGGYLGRSHIGEVTAAGPVEYLPKGAESIRAIEVLDGAAEVEPGAGAAAVGGARGGAPNAGASKGGGSEEVPAVIVFDRPGGLTHDDLNAIGALGSGLNRLGITGATPIIDPFARGPGRPWAGSPASEGGRADLPHGEAALLVLALNAADRGAIASGVGQIREYLGAHPIPGLHAYVTGPAGIAAD